jgi:hypothetical protein
MSGRSNGSLRWSPLGTLGPVCCACDRQSVLQGHGTFAFGWPLRRRERWGLCLSFTVAPSCAGSHPLDGSQSRWDAHAALLR